MEKLILSNIHKFYGERQVLNDISFTVKKGELAVLLGPSGCGKSTILNIISGIVDQSAGDLFFDDKLINKISVQNRNIAMVFQNFGLYPHLSVRENIAFPLKVRHLEKEEITKKVDYVAKLLDIMEHLDRDPSKLSGGQKQRVAIGRAIIREPSVFLMDEPLSSLDANLRIQLRSEIKTLVKKLNVPTVYVTHDKNEALAIATSLYVVKDGEIVQFGSPEKVFKNPKNLFVASFLYSDSLNVLPGYFYQFLVGIGFIQNLAGTIPKEVKTIAFDANFVQTHNNVGVPYTIIDTDYFGQYILVKARISANSQEIIVKFQKPILDDKKCLYVNVENVFLFDEHDNRILYEN